MAETGAIFGGEHSAHYYFRDNFADSGSIAALLVLQQLSLADVPLSPELRKPFESATRRAAARSTRTSTTRPP